MDFDFSAEQKEIRHQARRMLAAECDSSRVRRMLDGETLHDAALWQQIASLGWLGVAIPEAYGGMGLGYGSLCVIAEELGRALAPVPVASSIYLAAEAILQAGDDDAKQAWLPALAAGEKIGTLALAEGMSPLASPDSVQTCCIGGMLSGTKLPVPDGCIADFAIVSARTAGAGPLPSRLTPPRGAASEASVGAVDSGGDITGLFVVELDAPGVRRETLQSIDPSRPQARIVFDNAVAVPLGTAGQSAAVLRRVLDRAAVLVAFEQIGGADAALAMATDYAKLRHAFGRPIGSFQAIKHKLADMYTRNELARSNAYYAAWALDSSEAELPLAAAAARVAASEAYEYAAKENIQTHGGIGATWEADMHLHYRRSRLLMLMLDSPPQWRQRLVAQLERRAAA